MRRLLILLFSATILALIPIYNSGIISKASYGENTGLLNLVEENYWEITVGGPANEHFRYMTVADNSLIITGMTDSFGQGSSDMWIIKLNLDGYVLWEKTLGSNMQDWGQFVTETLDSGYLLIGRTPAFGAGDGDIWIIKLTQYGDIEWQKTYGGIDDDKAYSAHELSNGDFYVVGTTQSFGTGPRSTLLMKINSDGNLLWQKAYGRNGYDDAYRSILTSDDGILIIGDTDSIGSGINPWLLKVKSDGNIEWQKTYQFGTAQDEFLSIRETNDGGFIAVGFTNSFGSHDVLLAKLDDEGSIEWGKVYGGSEIEFGFSVIQASDNSYVFAGYTTSFGVGNHDGWIVKVNQTGNILWERSYGWVGWEHFADLYETQAGRIIVVGETNSFGAGSYDLWTLKLNDEGDLPECSIVNDTVAQVSDVNATVITSTFGTQTSNIIASNTTITPEDVYSASYLYCYYPIYNIFMPMICKNY